MSLPSCDLKFCDCDAHDNVLTLCVPLIGGVFFTMVSEDHVNENCLGIQTYTAKQKTVHLKHAKIQNGQWEMTRNTGF